MMKCSSRVLVNMQARSAIVGPQRLALRWLFPALLLATLGETPALADTPARSASAEDLAFFEKKVRPLLVRRCQDCRNECLNGISPDP